MNYGDFCALAGGILSTLAYISQIYKIYCDKSGENLSYMTGVFINLMNTLFIFYYYQLNGMFGVAICFIGIVLQTIIASQKYYYSKKKKQVLIK